jgi:uncharacterized protein (TIGR02246 family)
MRTTLIPIVVLIFGAAAGLAGAQGSRGTPEGERGVRETLAAYGVAFDKGDAEGVRALFTADAEFVSSAGQRIQGPEAIFKRLQDYRQRHPGDRIRLTVGTIRFPAESVAQVEGNAEVRGPGGPPDISPYMAILVRREGKWLLDSVRDLSGGGDDEEMSPAERLQELAWMVGEWRQTGGGITVAGSCRWDKKQNFLLWDYTVETEGKELMSVTQRIGWDPLRGQFRSWIFDSEGGYAVGQWEKDEGAWAIRQSGVLADGGTASAVARLTPVDRNAFRWQLTQRRVGGEKLPDVNVRFTRSGEPK